MKKRKHYLYFPENVSIKQYLDQFKKSHFCENNVLEKGDDYLTLRLVACVSFLYVATLRTKDRKVRIHSETFRSLLGEHSSRFVNFLCRVGVPPMFCIGESYKVGERSREYCRNEEYVSRFKPCIEFDPEITDKLFSSYKAKRIAGHQELHYPVPELKAIAAQLVVDRTEMDQAIQKYVIRKNASKEPYDLDKAETLLDIVEYGPEHHGYFFFRENSRLYSSITNLPREFRSLLRYKGLPFVELDQCASQPFLLLRLYQEDRTNATMREAADYYSLWSLSSNNGDFYSNLIAGLSPGDRFIVKSSFIKDFLNRADYMQIRRDPIREVWRKHLETLFSTRFPILHQKIKELKTVRKSEIPIDGNAVHKQFAVALQQMESTVFIDKIAAECMERRIPIYTVHDCIGCLEEDKIVVTEIAMRHLTQFCGFEPRFK